MNGFVIFSVLLLAPAVMPAQQAADQRQTDQQQTDQQQTYRQDQSGKQSKKVRKKDKSTVSDIGGGIGSTAGGAAKGAGTAAAGVGKGTVDAVTLHPINAAGDVGSGAVRGTKDVTVGAAKGVGKVGKGVGHAFKKIF